MRASLSASGMSHVKVTLTWTSSAGGSGLKNVGSGSPTKARGSVGVKDVRRGKTRRIAEAASLMPEPCPGWAQSEPAASAIWLVVSSGITHSISQSPPKSTIRCTRRTQCITRRTYTVEMINRTYISG